MEEMRRDGREAREEQSESRGRLEYEAPKLTELGQVTELTHNVSIIVN